MSLWPFHLERKSNSNKERATGVRYDVVQGLGNRIILSQKPGVASPCEFFRWRVARNRSRDRIDSCHRRRPLARPLRNLLS